MSYYERNRAECIRRSTEYNLKNKEEIKEYQRNYFKQYYQDHKDEILHRLRDYYDKNIRTNQVRKDKISIYKKEYYKKNKKAIKQKKFTKPCNIRSAQRKNTKKERLEALDIDINENGEIILEF